MQLDVRARGEGVSGEHGETTTTTRTYLEDGDEVILRGEAVTREGIRIGFGRATARVSGGWGERGLRRRAMTAFCTPRHRGGLTEITIPKSLEPCLLYVTSGVITWFMVELNALNGVNVIKSCFEVWSVARLATFGGVPGGGVARQVTRLSCRRREIKRRNVGETLGSNQPRWDLNAPDLQRTGEGGTTK